MSKKLPGPGTEPAKHQLLKLSVGQRQIFALVDSGAPVSLLSSSTYHSLGQNSILTPPSVNLKSVTGQQLEVVGTAEVTFNLAEALCVSHEFQITKNLEPYEAIIGLDFLADPNRRIQHQLSNFTLTYGQTPVRLFNSDLLQPCETVLAVKATGRHQYVGPRSVTFIRAKAEKPPSDMCPGKTEGLEFHLHAVQDGAPRPIPCFFDSEQFQKNELFVGFYNESDQGTVIKNDETIGFLTPVSTQPFQDLVASVIEDRSQNIRTKPKNHQSQSETPEKNSRDPTNSVDQEQKSFLESFQYGDLDESQKKRVQNLLLQYRDCFLMEGDKLGLCNRAVHRVETITDEPVVTQPYRVPKALEVPVKKLIQKMLEQNLIRKSQSEYSSPVVLVEKPDKSLRLCVNYQKLNAICKKRMFPLPNPDELLAKIGENQPKWFSSTDLAAAFHQVPIHEEDKHKTASALPWALFEWHVLPTGLASSPICFARLGQEIFGDLLSKQGLVLFIDDLCLYSPTFDDHLDIWRKVLDLLRESNLKLKPSKTSLFSTEGLKFLGHHVGPGGISPNPQKLDSISQYPTPKTVKDVRAFTALCSYFRKKCPLVCVIGRTITQAHKKRDSFQMDSRVRGGLQRYETCADRFKITSLPSVRACKSLHHSH